MINSFFVNASILIAFIYIGSQIFKDNLIISKPNFKTKLLVGMLFGVTGCLLMLNSVRFSNSFIIDFRAFALIISFIYCGPISAFMTMSLMIIFRLTYFGVSSASYSAALTLLFLYIAFYIIQNQNLKFEKKYISMCIINIISFSIVSWLLFTNIKIFADILGKYLPVYIVVSVIIYFVLNYIYKTSQIYHKLKHESSIDFLTGLYNVREFDKCLNRLMYAAVEKGESLSLIMIDIDFFKRVNDNYGHSSGDMVLKQISEIIPKSCRTFDIVARKGGEEFTVILSGCGYTLALNIAETIRKNVENYLFTIDDEKKIKITVSLGVSTYPEPTNDINFLLHEADDALYLAKRSGRNIVK